MPLPCFSTLPASQVSALLLHPGRAHPEGAPLGPTPILAANLTHQAQTVALFACYNEECRKQVVAAAGAGVQQ